MEDKSNTSHEKEQSRLRLSCDKKTFDFLESLDLSFEIIKTNTKNSILNLQIIEDQLYLNYKKNNVRISLENKSLISYLLKEMIYSKEPNGVTCSHHFDKMNDLNEYLAELKKIEIFKSYTHTQIIYHINGQGEAFSISSNHKGIYKSTLTVLEYNNLFSKIKKSKNKIFNQRELQLDQVFSVGAFMAKEVTTQDFSFIVIISRDDIFNPTENEINLFEKTILINKFHTIKAIKSDISHKHTQLINSLIENFPIPIELKEDNGKLTVAHGKIKTTTDYHHYERLELMGELLNTLRHELSNPLFGINISSSLLKTDSHEKEDFYLETIDEIAASSKRCQNILENFTNLYDTKQTRKEFKLLELINETLVLTKSESKFFRPEIKAYDNFQDITLESNPTLVSQIIFNLVVNSSQALKDFYDGNEGRIYLSLYKENEYLRIEVSDNGPGIPDNIKEEIFNPFITTKEKGTGLGLTICKSIADKLGGSLLLDKKYTNGSKFILRLPYE